MATQMVEKQCEVCGKAFFVPIWRKDKARFCSQECQHKTLHAKPDVECTYCHKKFHMKKYQLQHYARSMGVFCSRACETRYRSLWFRGENNHQFGLKGDKNASFKIGVLDKKNNKLIERMVYAPNRVDANRSGRIPEHRLVVEENWERFRPDAFELRDGQHVLKHGYDVHHIDGNHNNNELSNLAVLTRGEHTSLHNKEKIIVRDDKGRVKTVIKAEELSHSDRGDGGFGSTGK